MIARVLDAGIWFLLGAASCELAEFLLFAPNSFVCQLMYSGLRAGWIR